MVEERGSGEAGCAGRATGYTVVLREKKRKHFWETGPRQYIILVERHPKSSCTKTQKQREY